MMRGNTEEMEYVCKANIHGSMHMVETNTQTNRGAWMRLQSKTGRWRFLLGGKAGSVAAGKWFRSWLGRRTGRWPTGGERSEPTGHQRDRMVSITTRLGRYYDSCQTRRRLLITRFGCGNTWPCSSSLASLAVMDVQGGFCPADNTDCQSRMDFPFMFSRWM